MLERLKARIEQEGLSGIEARLGDAQDLDLDDDTFDTAVWEVEFDSAQHLWDMVIHSNPIAVQLTAGLDDDRVSEVQQVLDGMLRERSGGTPSAVLHGATNIGTGIA